MFFVTEEETVETFSLEGAGVCRDCDNVWANFNAEEVNLEADGELNVGAEGMVDFEAEVNVEVEGKGNVEAEGKLNIEVKGKLNSEGEGKVDVEAKGNVNIELSSESEGKLGKVNIEVKGKLREHDGEGKLNVEADGKRVSSWSAFCWETSSAWDSVKNAGLRSEDKQNTKERFINEFDLFKVIFKTNQADWLSHFSYELNV